MSDSNGVAAGPGAGGPGRFKKGDRVKVEFEGTVAYVGQTGLDLDTDDGGYRYAAPSDATLLERPVEPLAVGSIVRSGTGSLWRVQRYRVEFIGANVYDSGFDAKTLAGVLRDYPNDYTLIYDGSKA